MTFTSTHVIVITKSAFVIIFMSNELISLNEVLIVHKHFYFIKLCTFITIPKLDYISFGSTPDLEIIENLPDHVKKMETSWITAKIVKNRVEAI